MLVLCVFPAFQALIALAGRCFLAWLARVDRSKVRPLLGLNWFLFGGVIKGNPQKARLVEFSACKDQVRYLVTFSSSNRWTCFEARHLIAIRCFEEKIVFCMGPLPLPETNSQSFWKSMFERCYMLVSGSVFVFFCAKIQPSPWNFNPKHSLEMVGKSTIKMFTINASVTIPSPPPPFECFSM